MQTFESPFGKITLQRLPLPPKGKQDNLRAWDAADELSLSHVAELDILSNPNLHILVLNDAFGALSVALNKYSSTHLEPSHLHVSSDSYVSHLAIDHNLALNHLKSDHVAIPSINPYINSDDDSSSQKFDLVLIKVPKTLALLEYQLAQLKPHITESTVILGAGMVKHIHTSTLKCFEKYIGTTTTSRATKKARLIFSKNDQTIISPSAYPKPFTDKTIDIELSNHANVFSKDHLDIGARFMIEHLGKCPESKHIIDLGCGNGVLGIMAKKNQRQALISFVDESYMAIDSTKTNYKQNLEQTELEGASFIVSNCLDDFKLSNSHTTTVDLILCNPPFHQAHSIGDHIAWQMFVQSRELLSNNGELWIIGNRHLGYHIKLKKLFGNCRTIASNKKFVILVAKQEPD